MTKTSDGDEFTETGYAVLLWFNEHHPSGSKYPPRPKGWADIGDVGDCASTVYQEFRNRGIDLSPFDHHLYVVPKDDYDPSQEPRGYGLEGPVPFEATPNEIAKMRAIAAQADDE